MNYKLFAKQRKLFCLLLFLLPVLPLLALLFLGIPRYSLVWYILTGFILITPSISALIADLATEGLIETRRLLWLVYMEYINPKYLILAFVIPLLLIGIARGAGFLIDPSLPVFALPNEYLTIALAFFATEFGFRNFLQNRLALYFEDWFLPIVLGVLWTLWFYPFILLSAIPVPVYLVPVYCITHSYIYFWLTKRSEGNILPATIMNVVMSLAIPVFTLYTTDSYGYQSSYYIFLGLSLLLSLVFAVSLYRKQRLSD